jgi:ATP-dependent RNA helicase DeaD
MESPVATLVFCRTRDEVDQLAETLNGRGYRAEALHGGMDQQQRDRVMGRLRSRNAELLVCTDVAARGLDVEHLSHVVNFDVPSAPESYVHRIGRVGRGGRDGVAITIAEPREHRLLKTIGRVTRQDISVERLPSSADLHNRRLELTRAALYEVCLDDDLDDYRVVLDSLSDDFDVVRVALAAVKLAHRQTTPEGGEEEIPQPDRQDRGDRRGRDERPGERRPRKDRGGESGARSGKTGDRRTGDDRDDERARDDRGDDSKGRRTGKGKSGDDSRHSGPGRRERDPRRGADDASQQGARPPKPGRKDRRSEPTARVFISAGRASGLRPQDVVGAIANEAGLSGRDIGAIEIADRFAIVEVPQSSGKDVIAALNRTRLQGNRVKARYDRR